MRNNDVYVKELSELKDGVILNAVSDPNGEFFGLRIAKNNKAVVLWFLSDDEGNAPGAYEISPQSNEVV